MVRQKRNLSEPRPIKTPVSPQTRKRLPLGDPQKPVDPVSCGLNALLPQQTAGSSSTSLNTALTASTSSTSAPRASSPGAPPWKQQRPSDDLSRCTTSPTDSSGCSTPPRQSDAHPTPNLTYSLPTSSSTFSPLLTLPNELLLHIASYLPEPHLARLLLCNRRLHTLLTHLLYRRGIHIEYLDARTLLHHATESGFYLTTIYLLDSNAPLNLTSSPRGAHPLQHDGLTPLHIAVTRNRLRIARALLAYGVKTKVWDASGATPLHTAVELGRDGMVKLLIRSGAKLSPRNADGMRPLHIAVLEGRKRAAKMLIAAGVDVNARDDKGITALHFAAGMGDVGMVERLLEAGADVEGRDGEGGTALLWGCAGGAREVVGRLIKRGASVGVRDREGRGVLHFIGKRGDGGLWKMLVSLGADVGLKDKTGALPELTMKKPKPDVEEEGAKRKREGDDEGGVTSGAPPVEAMA